MLILFFAAHSFLTAARGGQDGSKSSAGGLTLEVRKPTDPTKDFRGSRWYFADLHNNSPRPLKVVAIKRPEGYQGGGLVFFCYLEAWKSGQKQWRPLWSPTRVDYGYGPDSELKDVDIKPGGSEEVCGLLLPDQAGTHGQCVRFGMRTRWVADPERVNLVSKPFIIGNVAAKPQTPCTTK